MPSKFLILVISDDPQLAQILNQAAQCSFSEAIFNQIFSPAEAKKHIETQTGNHLNLILLDSDVGESMDELNFLAFVRAHEATYRLPIYILTTGQLPCDLIASYSVSATSLTAKPFSLDDWTTYLTTIQQTYMPA